MFCFGLGFGKGVVESAAMNPQRICQVIPTSDSVIAVNQQGQLLQWKDGEKHESRLVFIGRELDAERLTKSFDACLAA